MSIVAHKMVKEHFRGSSVAGLTLEVNPGEIFGLFGPSGSGKTLALQIMAGFVKPDSGNISILDMDCYLDRVKLRDHISYMSSRIPYSSMLTGIDFLRAVARLNRTRTSKKRDELLSRLKLNADMKIAEMTLEDRQKLSSTAAMMCGRDVLLLDKPTQHMSASARETLFYFLNNERSAGRTILMATDDYDDVEKACDRVGFVKKGKLIALEPVEWLIQRHRQEYFVSVTSEQDIRVIENAVREVLGRDELRLKVAVSDYRSFFSALSRCNVISLESRKSSTPLPLEIEL